MGARDALHFQMIFRDSMTDGALTEALLDSFDKSQRGILEHSDGAPVEAVPNQVGLFARPGYGGTPYQPGRLISYFRRHLDLALPFYVEPAMTPVVTAAAETMPSEPLLPSDLPSTHGFLLLPNGLGQVDIRGQFMVHNAVVWFERAGGIDLWYLSNKNDPRDMINMRHRREFTEAEFDRIPLLMPATYSRIEYGEGVPYSLGGTQILPPELAEKVQVHTDPRTGQYAWFWPEGYDMEEWVASAAKARPDGPTTWLFAMWRLMQQTLADVRTEDVDRPLRRAVAKRKMKQNQVTVIKLRKRKAVHGEGTGEGANYSHRFWRRGHWRQQWYGPVNGEPDERYQRSIYIHPTLVWADHEDLPILVRDHVYDLAR